MSIAQRTRQSIAVALVVLLCLASIRAGITVTGADGITVTGADGIQYIRTSGITVTGADGYLFFAPNGITVTGADGSTAAGANGIMTTGADGYTFTGANGITATGADGITVTGADGITVTGADGITVTGADGTTYNVNSIVIRKPTGITVTGADGITARGVNGITAPVADSRQIARADGITVTGADGITVTGADGITVTGADGQIMRIAPTGITVTGADMLAGTGADGITVTGADAFTEVNDMADTVESSTGLRSVDPELAIILNRVTDDSNVNAVVVYHHKPTDADIADLQAIGVTGGTRYKELPMVALTATRRQIFRISHLPAVRSIYGNRTLQPTMDPYLALTGSDRVRNDSELTNDNNGQLVSGGGVTVAVLDTGVDGTHADLVGRVVQNVKLFDAQSVAVGFTEPVNVENVANTDQAYGHGTFVAGLIAGSGSKSSGKYNGVAPGARLVGLSAGDLNLSYVLSGFDYLLAKGAGLNVRVVNCSFSANTVYDTNDPVNVATKMLTERGVNVVFSAGNTGSGEHSLNPYAVAPWVISVGATDQSGRLASFSSRGDFGSRLFRPTIVAPGVNVVSTRAAGVNVTGTTGIAPGVDTQRLSTTELPYYTTASGTSFSAPQVAGTIALMLEVNPSLTPRQVRDILQRTATPLPAYFQHEVGAGMLNSYAAVVESAFPERRMGLFRATLDQGKITFVNQSVQQFSGSVAAMGDWDVSVNVPSDAVLASAQTGWAMTSASDLALTVYDQAGTKMGEADSQNRSGLTGRSEGLTMRSPAPGQLRVHVSQPLGTAAQPILGLFEVTRVDYAPLTDLAELSLASRSDVQEALRTFILAPYGNRFRPGFGVTRAELAGALVRSGRVPQYMSAQAHYTDVTDRLTMLFVESAQNARTGPVFTDVVAGNRFRPDDYATRLTTAVAFVRAAGLQSEATAAASQPLLLNDLSEIPVAFRGYVSVAISHGWLTVENGYFRAQQPLTRAELAHAVTR